MAHILESLYRLHLYNVCLVVDKIWVILDSLSHLCKLITLLQLNIYHSAMDTRAYGNGHRQGSLHALDSLHSYGMSHTHSRTEIGVGSVGLKVSNGKTVQKGEPITDGALYPQDVLRISGVEAVQDYLVQSVQAVYRQQGVEINDKHIEVIIRQMMRKVRIEDAGDSTLLVGTVVDSFIYEDALSAVQARIDAGEEDLRLPVASAVLMGITKASLATDSFLSAASFQETTKVLTDAAIKGKVDHLVGLKENVIIGKLIPAGSGLMAYRDFQPGTAAPELNVSEDPESEELN